MNKISKEEIEDLISKFSDQSLPVANWNHRAHLIVGLWHNIYYDADEALDLVRLKIQTYNLSVGTPNTEDSGYHETLTVFWMTITKRFLQTLVTTQIEEMCYQYFQSGYASKDFPFEYYSYEFLYSKRARAEWVEGDIKKVSSFLC